MEEMQGLVGSQSRAAEKHRPQGPLLWTNHTAATSETSHPHHLHRSETPLTGITRRH
ncbi:hypothetical protein M407DRAFT_246159 [Tulasnella calospora MUT 4182]|uniref:Uncharacterized protein n=1 Tax=Tulasnella calospora MUT 4182 TaxID=1051891 RepID=A0A0C3LDB0_9AGAM|nr:hypothetical protein M407DRAFT_246159 [Tulasnella calospora MUT 4182]